ncbi:cuticle protein-like [Hetaerina americana]|uniref:cuticle protein-like n=1 Tax=Hetaerina americana TaxID=62018 RepID=UPI003A7F1190
MSEKNILSLPRLTGGDLVTPVRPRLFWPIKRAAEGIWVSVSWGTSARAHLTAEDTRRAMRSLLFVFAVVGVAVARPGYLGLGLGAIHASRSIVSPVAYSTIAAAPAPVVYAAPQVASSQYHAQDELGQYSYGYAGGPSAKSEIKTWDGVTRGGYSYVDAEGKVQSVNYVADAVNGFRVAATNLPVAPVAPEPIPAEPLVAPLPVEDTAEVAAAKEAHFAAIAEAKAAAEAAPEEPAEVAVEAEPVVAEPAAVAIAPAAVTYAAPAPIAPISYSAVAPVASSQYHAQDELGQYSYGYAGGPSAKSEVKSWDGVTRGGYSYVDAEGKLQSVNYVADPINGFRVAATNLPVAPAAPATVPDSPEVVEAKAAHFAAHEEAKARLVA